MTVLLLVLSTLTLLAAVATFLVPSHIKEDVWVRLVRRRYRFLEHRTERRRRRKQRRYRSRYSWADHLREMNSLPESERHKIEIGKIQLEALRAVSTVRDYHWMELYVAHQLHMSVKKYRLLPIEERVAWDLYFLGYFHNKREWRRTVERSFDYFASLADQMSEDKEGAK